MSGHLRIRRGSVRAVWEAEPVSEADRAGVLVVAATPIGDVADASPRLSRS